MKLRFLVLIILCVLMAGCKDKEVSYGVTYRPEDFPEILTPLDGATEIRYSSPETGKIVEGTYSISFWIDEEYPAPNTIERIQNYFKSLNCIRVEWTADDFSVYDNVKDDTGKRKTVENIQETQEFRDSLKANKKPGTQWCKPHPKSNAAKVIGSSWVEEWITEDDGLAVIHLDYYLLKLTDFMPLGVFPGGGSLFFHETL